MRVALIPTGKLELQGLWRGLAAAYPGQDFHCVPLLTTPGGERTPFNSFTSATLPQPNLHEHDSSLSELVGAIIDELYPRRKSDLIFVLEDLELCNKGNEAVVVREFGDAVGRQLQKIRSTDANAARSIEQMLRDSVSFHLAAPMIESWLFADPAGPSKAGVPGHQLPPLLRPGCDPEDFSTDDPSYSADEGQGCTRWCQLRQPRSSRPEWLKIGLPREEHPKRYMAWLCRDPDERSCSRYAEVPDGANALAQLDWAATLAEPLHMRYLRSFLADLADALAVVPTGWSTAGAQAPLTSVKAAGSRKILRNI